MVPDTAGVGALAACLDRSTPAEPGVVERMLRAAPHRGGTLAVQVLGRCVLGTADTEDGAESSIASSHSLAIAVCGKVDNLAELSSGRRTAMAGSSPAAVIRDLIGRSGDGAINQLRGAFTAIVTDGSSIRAFRDHVGFGLLHYRQQGPTVYVATEAKQILAGSGLPREPEPEFLNGLLFDRYLDQSLCALRGVRRLPQGSLLSAGAHDVRVARYWHPDGLLESDRPQPHELRERFDALMSQAVRRVMADDEVISLSGGIDSPAVAAYAAPEHRRRFGRQLPAIAAVYPQFPSIDERAAVELVARELGIELHLYEPQARPLDGLRERVRRDDGPAPASFARLGELYERARELGFRTILSGSQAEFVTDVGHSHLVTHLVRERRVRALAALIRRQRARGSPLDGIFRRLARAVTPDGLLDLYDRRPRSRGFGPDWLDSARFAYHPPNDLRRQGRWAQAQLISFYLPRLTIEADEIEQTASGVRTRYPWADVDLWEFFLRLPAETKYADVWPSKLLARDLLRGKVPDAILDRWDKMIGDDMVMTLIDYGFLRDLLINPRDRVTGVDYPRLAEHLRREDLPARDFRYIRILAAIHVFLDSGTAVP